VRVERSLPPASRLLELEQPFASTMERVDARWGCGDGVNACQASVPLPRAGAERQPYTSAPTCRQRRRAPTRSDDRAQVTVRPPLAQLAHDSVHEPLVRRLAAVGDGRDEAALARD